MTEFQKSLEQQLTQFDESVAFHEAGHAVVAIKTNRGLDAVMLIWNESHQNWEGSTVSPRIELPANFNASDGRICPGDPNSFRIADQYTIAFAGCAAQALYRARCKVPDTTIDRSKVGDLFAWMLAAATRPESFSCSFVDTQVELERRCFSGNDHRIATQNNMFVDVGDRLHRAFTHLEDNWDMVVAIANALTERVRSGSGTEALLDKAVINAIVTAS